MKLYENITPELQDWIKQQKLFFVGTAPLSGEGHVNLSPKGHDCLRILDNMTVCYLDMSGSGNETAAHVQENGRITFMWCAVEGPPRILRVYGRGQVIVRDSASPTTNDDGNNDEWKRMIDAHYGGEVLPGARQIIVNHVHRVQTSCGYAVPFFDYKEDRETLKKFFGVQERKEGGMIPYWKLKNMKSIDGLPTSMTKLLGDDSEGDNKGSSEKI